MLEARCADLLHHGVGLGTQQFERALDAGLPERAEAQMYGRPTHTAVAPMHSLAATAEAEPSADPSLVFDHAYADPPPNLDA